MTDIEKRIEEIEGFYSNSDDDGHIEWLITQLRSALERERVLREAVEYYANRGNWFGLQETYPKIGKRARAAIKQVEEMK